MKFNRNVNKLIISLAIITAFPVNAFALDNFWGDNTPMGSDFNYAPQDYTNTYDRTKVPETSTVPELETSNSEKEISDTTKQEPEDNNILPAVNKTDTPKVKDIEIYGANVISPDLVMQKINLQRGDEYSRDIIQNDLKAIYQLGFFTEKMKAIPVQNPDGTVTLKILLEENLPVTDFTIEGNTVIGTDEILPFLLPMKGKPQHIGQINEAIAAIQDLYNQRGYILARVDSVSDDPDGTINISIKEGTINQILIAGNEKTKDFILKRNILTEPGVVYNENLIKEDLVRLYATQAFKDVTRDIEPNIDNPDTYDVTINVQEQRTASISVGGGIDSVTGVFGSVGISDNNFRGMNQRLSLNGLVGSGVILNDASIKRRMNIQAELSFYEPHFLNADTSLMHKIYYRDFGSYQVPLAIEKRLGYETTIGHRLKVNRNLTATMSAGVEGIKVKEGDSDKIFSLYAQHNVPISERAKQLEGGVFLSLSPALVYDTRDSATVTRKGTLASIRFDEEIGLDGLDKTHGKLSGSIKQYIPVGRKSSLSFAGRAGGKIHGDNMPEVMAYRLGGPYTVRGFKMSGVGTGDAFIMGSVEFATPIPFVDRTRFNFLNNVRLTAWMDAGKIFNPTVSDTIYDRPMHAVTAGVGLKLYIPGMGPLSVDYGIPLTNPGSNGNKNGYFTFGVGDIMY